MAGKRFFVFLQAVKCHWKLLIGHFIFVGGGQECPCMSKVFWNNNLSISREKV